MNYTVLITRTAQRDLARAADYIEFSLKNPTAADALLAEASRTLSALSSMPERWPMADDRLLRAWGVRCARVKNYLAFYTVSAPQKTVTVLRFLYGRSDWMSLLHRALPGG